MRCELTIRSVLGVLLCLLCALEGAQAQTVAAPAPVWPGLQYPADVLMDAFGRESLAEVQARFERGDSQKVIGNPVQALGGEQVAWFRIGQPGTETTDTVKAAVLTVAHSGMDSVVLYVPVAGGGWAAQRAGDSIPVAAWPMPFIHPAFAFDISPADVRPLYLAVRHSHPISVYWQLWDRRSFDQHNKNLHMMMGGYLGFIVLVVILSVFNAVNWRDSIHLFYALYVMVLGCAQFSLTGLAGEYFWPRYAWWNDIASVVLPMLGVLSAALFSYHLVAERGDRLVSGLLWSAMALSGGFALGFIVMGREPFFHLSNLSYLYLFPLQIGILAWFSLRRPRVGLWALAGFLCLVVGSIFPVLRNLNWLPINFYTQFGAQIGVAFEIPLVLVALYIRSRERGDSQVRLSALSRVDPVTGVASQRVLMERLDHLLQRHRRDPQIGAVLRVRLMNTEAIRAEYGADVVLAALVRAATCATLPALDGDTVGRYRDGDFVVLLEGKTSLPLIADAAQRIIAEGLRQSRSLPASLVLQLHVACADSPMLGDDGMTLLRQLEGVLDQISKQPNKALRFLRQKTLGQLPALNEMTTQ